MAITDYTSIRTELNNHTKRAYSQAQVDTFLGLAEADINLLLGPNYVRETNTTITTDSTGVASLPSGFQRFISLSHGTYGNIPLVAWEVLSAFNPTGAGGIPEKCAIQGNSIKVAYVFEGSLTLNYATTLTPLTASSPTNWLLLKAPQVYFLMVFAQSKLFEEEYQLANAAKSEAAGLLSALGVQSMVAQFGRAQLKLRGGTP